MALATSIRKRPFWSAICSSSHAGVIPKFDGSGLETIGDLSAAIKASTLGWSTRLPLSIGVPFLDRIEMVSSRNVPRPPQPEWIVISRTRTWAVANPHANKRIGSRRK